MKHILKCISCNKYTMQEVCGCGAKTAIAKPMRYTHDDKFSSYRRRAKIEDYIKRGLL
ncbi:ribosome biogenesis protein [Candidatus Woesearchaeota archaeon]|nr:ribosome biogenesis protein [Candidatus Woesearchaeota archaeon]